MIRHLRGIVLTVRCDVCGWRYPMARSSGRVVAVDDVWWCMHCVQRIGDPRQLELDLESWRPGITPECVAAWLDVQRFRKVFPGLG